MTRPLLEIAAGSLGSALAAQAGGADRIELCATLSQGGTTPSHGALAATRDRVRIPLYVLIRPRIGDFCYDPAELEVMRRDVEMGVTLGCERVLTSGGEATALAGAARIADVAQQARRRVRVVAGAGITPASIHDVAQGSGAHEIHASARALRTSSARQRNDRLSGLDADWEETDAGIVRALVDALDRL